MGEKTKTILIMTLAGLTILIPIGVLVWNNKKLRAENKSLRAQIGTPKPKEEEPTK